jgi:Putative beta-barrel porin-2, OmpL-like. bbp2/Carboxypeptidase regulatory-like domain
MNGNKSSRKITGLAIVCAVAVLSQSSVTAQDAAKVAENRAPRALAIGEAGRAATLGSLRGVTVTSAGLSLAAVDILIHSLTGALDRRLVSDQEGSFRLDEIPTGKYQITVSKEGFTSPAPATVEIAQNQVTNTDVALAAIVTSSSSAQAAATKPDPAPLTEREKQLLDRIDRLESRLAAMEAREANGATPPGTVLGPALQSAVASVVASSANAEKARPVEVAGVLPPNNPVTATPVQTAQNQAAQSGTPPVAQHAESAVPSNGSAPAAAVAAPAVDNQTPFAYADFTWLNGTPRNKDVVLDTPFFTPEIRFDTNFINDFNQPIDHTMGGSTEEFRNGEFQVEDIGIGGDFHWQNVRGRVMFMDGLFAVTTPRNDASSATGNEPGNTGGVGQWDLQDAYKYVSEAYGGYHFNVQHGLNVDAGIFVSYVGLFSYYNFDNWTYQPSYVSSNTPWFFEGLRIQWFPTNKLKIEPWLINGWQSYAKYNSHPGLGGQLLWLPKEWFKLVANQYSMGEDNLGLPNTQRIHTDDSIEIRYYNKPESTGIDKMALSFTADAGCQYGGGITCHGGPNKSSFLGWMEYNRFWWHKDMFAITLGGGQMNNTGRYLTLLPPIDGAWAAVGSAYFTQLPGQQAKMYDGTLTFHYMPKQYITWWAELGYRHSDVPYFSGRGGITPPGGNNGLPQYFTCMSGASSGTANLAAAQAACGGPGNVWFPDLRRSTSSLGFGVMVKF